MANSIFIFIFIFSFIYAVLTGRTDIVVNEILNSPKEALFIFIDIYILLIFWGGILQICKDNGLIDIFSSWISMLIHPLFKRLNRNSDALKYISMNFLANMLSMGSAATPFGLKAMEELQKINPKKDTASDEMITFLLINTSGLCLIPTILISIRSQYNSNNPIAIIPYIMLVSFLCTFFAIIFDIGGRKIAKY